MTARKAIIPLKKLSLRARSIVKAASAPLMPQLAKIAGRQHDLFDLAQVTEDDIRLWMLTIPKIDPDSRRAASYIKNYNVAEKIKRAKACGLWPPSNIYRD